MSTQELELTRLEPWLRANVPGFDGPLSAEKFPGGQSNPTFKLTAGQHEYVLRRKPAGELLASAHAVDREYRVFDALRDTDVPVPNAVALCADDDIIGSMFYVSISRVGFSGTRQCQRWTMPSGLQFTMK